jgi:RNA polymerase sigma-70 factor, ECF subfamily
MASSEGPAGTAPTDRLADASTVLLDALRSAGDRAQALRSLHEMALRAARREVARRRARSPVTGPELDDLAEHAASDAMLAVLAKLDDFRGESKFSTWVYKFVMFEVSTKLGRHFWARERIHIDAEDWDRLPDRLGIGPEDVAQARDLATAVRRAVERTLTAHQRRVFVALVLGGVPLEALVADLGSNRNAIYKTMFDARRKIRSALVADGYLDDDASRDR